MVEAASYTFGDADPEAQRLQLVARVFEPPSATLLAEAVAASGPPGLAYDLGCGPGHTTRLLAQVTGARLAVGLERSPAHVARAVEQLPEGVAIRVWDVGELPFPDGPADLAYARLLLAHLPDPLGSARAFASQLRPGGLLVLDEIERIDTDHPVLAEHLELVQALVASSGTEMCAGPRLAALADEPGLEPVLRRVHHHPVATADAAAMFSLSLQGWGERAVSLGLCTPARREALRDGLAALQRSPDTGEIAWRLHQAVYARVSGDPISRDGRDDATIARDAPLSQR